jgi:hypothetical protein
VGVVVTGGDAGDGTGGVLSGTTADAAGLRSLTMQRRKRDVFLVACGVPEVPQN